MAGGCRGTGFFADWQASLVSDFSPGLVHPALLPPAATGLNLGQICFSLSSCLGCGFTLESTQGALVGVLSRVGYLALELRMRLAWGRGLGRSVLCPSLLHVPTEHQSKFRH